MNRKKYRVITMTNIALIILLALAVITFGTVICIELFYEPKEVGRYSPSMLTREEMANRPIIKTSVTNTSANNDVSNSYEVEEQKEIKKQFIVYEEIPLDSGMQLFMQNACDEYHVGFAFALAIMESESSFEFVSGDSGKSIGYMQINTPNWYKYGLDAHYEYDNVEIGIRMLAELIEKYQECDMVVMAYKGGEGFAESWKEQGKRLDSCDTIVDRTMYWQEIINKY